MNIRKIALLFFAAVIAFGVLPNSSHGKIVVGLSSVNVAFLPVYVTEDRGFLKPRGWTCCWFYSMPARFAALSAKGVDASIVWFPVTEIAKSQGYNKLLDLKEIFPEWPYETFAAKQSWLNKEKDQVTKFLRAYQRGVKYTLENKTDSVRIMKKYVKIDPAYGPAGYDEYRGSFPLNGQIAEKAIPAVIEQEFESGRLQKKVTVEDMVDRSFMKALGK